MSGFHLFCFHAIVWKIISTMKTIKIFGVDMSGTLINAKNKIGNNIAYEVNLSPEFIETLSEELINEERNILVKDIKKYSLTRYNKKSYRLSLQKNWKEIFETIVKNTKIDQSVMVEDVLHLAGSTKEYFLYYDLEEYVHRVVQRILFKNIGIFITDSFIAEKVSECFKKYFPKIDFYLYLDKDTNPYGSSNKKSWQKWYDLCKEIKRIRTFEFFENSNNRIIQLNNKVYKRPENYLRVLKFGPNDT